MSDNHIAGIINSWIGRNARNPKPVRMIQVALQTPTDLREVQLFQSSGEKCHPVPDQTAVIIPITEDFRVSVSIEDDTVDDLLPGEKEIYALADSKTKGARIRFSKTGFAEVSNIARPTADASAVRYEELLAAYNQLRDDLNALIAVYNGHTNPEGGGTPQQANPSAADMTAAQSLSLRLS